MSKTEIIDNFLNKDDFEELKIFLMSPRSQWRFVDFIAHKDGRDQDKDGYFAYPNEREITSERNHEGNFKSVFNAQTEKIQDEIKEALIQAAQAAGAGNVPKEVDRYIKELTEPKMNWKEILQTQIQSTIKNDYTFSRPSRKGWHTGAVLPGMNFEESIDIVVSFDMSGSISDDQARDFLSEVKGIVSQYKEFKIKIWCFDTDVYNEQDFASDMGDDITTYQPVGGGGTEFDCNWRYMKDNDIQPKKFIMFTDGYPWSSWGDDSYCDTIFVIHGYHDKNFEAPFGITTHYE